MANPVWADCDDSFGPLATNCDAHRFDFTLKFEQSMLAIAPCVLFLACAIPRLRLLLGQSPKVERRSWPRAKTVGCHVTQLRCRKGQSVTE